MSICVDRGGVKHTYILLEKLGKGSFSQVYKCKRIVEGKEEIFVLNYTYFIIYETPAFDSCFEPSPVAMFH